MSTSLNKSKRQVTNQERKYDKLGFNIVNM